MAEQPISFPVKTIGQILPDGCSRPELVCPPDYLIKPDGVYRLYTDQQDNTRSQLICRAPVIITERLHDISTDPPSTSVVLEWYRDGRWFTNVFKERFTVHKHQMQALTDFGLPVSDEQSKHLVNYFQDFESVNREALAWSRVSSSLGWAHDTQVSESMQGFILGDRWIGSEDRVRYARPNEEDKRIVAGLGQQSGRFEMWRQNMTRFFNAPRAALAIYASLAPPLLRILMVDANHIVDWSCRTSRGKTTCLQVAASVWGQPSEQGGFIFPWAATRAALDHRMALFSDLPLMLDDSQKARTPEMIQDSVYLYSQGYSEAKSSPNGPQITRHWRGIMLSTGEHPLTSFCTEAGARTRILSIVGLPYEKPDLDDYRQLVENTKYNVSHHYGHAGPRWLDYLWSHQSEWGRWTRMYRSKQRELSFTVPPDYDKAECDRVAGYLAIHCITAKLAHEAGILDWDLDHDAAINIETLWPEIYAQYPDHALTPDLATRAMDLVRHKAVSVARLLEGCREWRERQMNPIGSWRSNKELAIPRILMDKWLQEDFPHPEEIYREWKKRGWTLCETQRTTKRATIGGIRQTCIVVERETMKGDSDDGN